MHRATVLLVMLHPSAVVTRAAVRELPEHAWDNALHAAVAAGTLHAAEADFARRLPMARRATFVAGREALRSALGQLPDRGDGDSYRDFAILWTARGAPQLPSHVTGSVTHKDTLAMAAVAPRGTSLQHVGIDLERRPVEGDLHSRSIARKILTAREFAYVQQWGEDTIEGRERILLHFALKEAVYKAIDPYVERYVGFTEVELEFTDERPRVTLHLPETSVAEVRIEAGWALEERWIVAWAGSHR
jgi:4'-phosphopantetheinyl transferase EntD